MHVYFFLLTKRGNIIAILHYLFCSFSDNAREMSLLFFLLNELFYLICFLFNEFFSAISFPWHCFLKATSAMWFSVTHGNYI